MLDMTSLIAILLSSIYGKASTGRTAAGHAAAVDPSHPGDRRESWFRDRETHPADFQVCAQGRTGIPVPCFAPDGARRTHRVVLGNHGKQPQGQVLPPHPPR